MNQQNRSILLSHGNGGQLMHDLINDLFLRYFDNPILRLQSDAAILPETIGDMAFTTDSFVVDPVFFPGGDIGKLAICGTVNDLAVSGAVPLYLSVGMILEEGLPLDDLETIVRSMAHEAQTAGVQIVTGDTKVVPRGKCDKIFINTSGIGRLHPCYCFAGNPRQLLPGDKILINGTIGDHGMAIMSARESFNFRSDIQSDCASLNHLIQKILDHTSSIKFMRDPTRGGVATVLNEIAESSGLGIEINETKLPIADSVKVLIELLGFELLHIANEGKVIVIAGAEEADHILKLMQQHPNGQDAAIIGTVTDTYRGKVIVNTEMGGKRVIGKLTGDPLPRIC